MSAGPHMTGKHVTVNTPLILSDSGSSRSVCGSSWAKWWRKHEELEFKRSQRSFMFAARPLIRSSGMVVIFNHVDAQCADSIEPLILPACVDVVDSNAPLLISYESLKKMKGSLDFTNA